MPIVHYQGAQVCSSIRVADGRCNVFQKILSNQKEYTPLEDPG